MDGMGKKRIYYLDIAKGIGVFLMVLGHVPDLTIPARQFVTSFHMPLFFVISGILMNATNETERDMAEIRQRKWRSIMVPYFVFSVLSLLVEAFCTGVLKNGLWEIFWEHLFATVCLSGASVFWFLPALFFGEMIFVSIRKKASEPVCGIAVAVTAVLAYFAHVGENRLQAEFGASACYPYLHLFLNGFLRVFFAAAFVAVGYFGFRLLQKLTDGVLWNLLSAVFLMALTLLVSHVNGVTDMNYMVYNNILLYLVTSVCGSFGIILLCRALEKWHHIPPLRVCMYYGRNSLIVMMTHAPFYIMYIAARVTYGINNHIVPLGQVLLCLLMVCLVLFIEIAVIEVINRRFPFLLGRTKRKERLE